MSFSLPHLPQSLDSFAQKCGVMEYGAIFCDVWGVLHNGIKAYPKAGEALSAFRAKGGRVVLVSNAPRPGKEVLPQLDHWGVPRSAYDDIVTSGDLARTEIAARPGPVLHIGPERDLPLFSGVPVLFASAEEASYVLCTGLYDDETETVEDYVPLLETLLARRLTMICANPDLVVERGSRLIPCAGAIAQAYEERGGPVHHVGKPHQPIYEAAHRRIEALCGRKMPKGKILAIGDALRTDITGAAHYGIRSLLIARGIHQNELMPDGAALHTESIARFLDQVPVRPDAILEILV
jgi:HAD superfamily hydrolase (TIGR01459 family)